MNNAYLKKVEQKVEELMNNKSPIKKKKKVKGFLEPKKEDIEYFNLYGTDFLHETTIRLDIRTYLSAYNHDITVSELIRIIKDNLRRDGYVDLRVTSSEPLSHLYRNMFRHAIEISYRKLNPS